MKKLQEWAHRCSLALTGRLIGSAELSQKPAAELCPANQPSQQQN
jgi:hypothetical protein